MGKSRGTLKCVKCYTYEHDFQFHMTTEEILETFLFVISMLDVPSSQKRNHLWCLRRSSLSLFLNNSSDEPPDLCRKIHRGKNSLQENIPAREFIALPIVLIIPVIGSSLHSTLRKIQQAPSFFKRSGYTSVQYRRIKRDLSAQYR